MLSLTKTTNSLFLKIVYMTAKSARQTTPNLIKNPRLTSRGIISPPSKSYAYDLPDNLKNRHLYWNNTVQNRIRRKEYNSHRLYKLGIKSIHDDKGVPLHNRTVEEILFELTNLRLIKESLGRTLYNLRDIAFNFPEVMKTEDKDLVLWSLDQVHDRYLGSMTLYEFSAYCHIRKTLKVPATRNLLVHIYKIVDAEVEHPTDKIKPKYFLQNMKYVFETAPVEEEKFILYPIQQEFKLFEDVAPPNKPLLDLLPKLFT